MRDSDFRPKTRRLKRWETASWTSTADTLIRWTWLVTVTDKPHNQKCLNKEHLNRRQDAFCRVTICRFDIFSRGSDKESRELEPVQAAIVGRSELNWCEKELGYLETELQAQEREITERRIKQIRSQLQYVDDLLSDIEDEANSEF